MDINRTATLLHIVDLVTQWPNLRGIHDLVMAELADQNVEALKALAEMKAKAEEAAAKEAEKVAAEARAATPAYQPERRA